MKHIAVIVLIAGCLGASGCMHRTVTTNSSYGTSASRQRNGDRGKEAVEAQTYWIWQRGFWKSDT